MIVRKNRLKFRWADAIPPEQWMVYGQALESLRNAHVRFMLGGGFALATLTGRWRNTKDMDLYIHPDQNKSAIAALSDTGFADYFSQQPYDRTWSHRNIKSDVIVDLLWGMANHRADVSDLWFKRAPAVTIRDQELLVIPAEELIWCKLYIIHRDRCDWTDLLNLVYARGAELDWKHLLDCLEDDSPLLSALLMIYGWLCPEGVRKLPKSLWTELGMRAPVSRPGGRNRRRLLDSRRWFAADQPANKKLEV
jgi:hypothetical protein